MRREYWWLKVSEIAAYSGLMWMIQPTTPGGCLAAMLLILTANVCGWIEGRYQPWVKN